MKSRSDREISTEGDRPQNSIQYQLFAGYNQAVEQRERDYGYQFIRFMISHDKNPDKDNYIYILVPLRTSS